ncbi:MAG TPA: TolC family protein [Candidatus Binatia bacterium]|nr:TolC family protein [Candidatus Binatia bacterium]
MTSARVRLAVVSLACAVCLSVAAARARAEEAAIAPGETLTLERAVAIALARHPAQKEAEAKSGAAAERAGEARSALLPQVYGVAEYLRATDNGIGDAAYLPALGIDRAPSQGRHENQLTDTFDNYLGGISAFQYLFDFGRTRGLIDQRDAEADAERARLDLVRLDLVFAVSKAFYGLVEAKKIATVYEKAVAQREEHLREATVRAKTGLRPEIDVATADADLARAQLRLVDARNRVATAKAALDEAMGLGDAAPDYAQAEAFTSPTVSGTVGGFLATALDRRPDLRMLMEEARASGARIEEVRSDYLPRVGAVAGYNVRGQENAPANNLYAGIVLTWPIFNGFLTDHQVEEAKLQEEAVRHAIENLRQRIGLQVRTSFLDWQAALERIRRAEKALEASRLALDLAEKRYEKGLGSIIELADAERQFTQDDADRVRALAGFAVAKAALQRDTGTGVPEATS